MYFLFQKVKILMKKRKNYVNHWLIMLVTMATPISSHMKDNGNGNGNGNGLFLLVTM